MYDILAIFSYQILNSFSINHDQFIQDIKIKIQMTLISKSVVLAVLLMTVLVSSDIISIDTNDRNLYGAANDNDNGNGKNGDSNNGNGEQNRANDKSNNGKGKKWGLDMTWQQFKDSFELSFTEGAEDDEKRKNWEESVKQLKNSKCQENCGVNPTFIKSKEQKNNMLGLLVGKPDFSQTDYKYYDNPDGFQLSNSGTPSVGAPTSIDWRNYGIVTSVKNQGSCGSCWAFAATGFLESQYIKRNKVANTLNLAEHFLNQCDTRSGGCNGGNPFSAAALGVAKGMPSQARMPYRIGYNYPSTYCTSPVVSAKFTKSGQVVSTYSSTNNQRDDGIISYLQYRPVIIALYASEWFNYYPASTLTIDQKVFSCSYDASVTKTINHAVLLVGFTSTYWIVKNSWGTGWGDKGYIYINRDPNKNCGIGKWYGSLSTII